MNLAQERPLTLTDAGRLVGKHVATIYRWSTKGLNDVVLETLQVGGTRCTTREALQRFCERLTPNVPLSRQGSGRVERGAQRAARELERYGV